MLTSLPRGFGGRQPPNGFQGRSPWSVFQHAASAMPTSCAATSTATSRPSTTPFSTPSRMARQCHLTNQQLRDFVDCSLSRSDYESVLAASDVLQNCRAVPGAFGGSVLAGARAGRIGMESASSASASSPMKDAQNMPLDASVSGPPLVAGLRTWTTGVQLPLIQARGVASPA